MAQVLDKQGLQHYANKICNADNRKVGSKSLPTALNDIDTAIDGFKTLFESEYGSALNIELENNENVFSVGTGTNVDKRSEIENSFTDVELSGNSLVNLSATKQLLNQTSTHYSDVYLCESSRLKANTSYRLEYDFECNIDFTFSKCYLGYSTSKGSMIAESSIKFDAKKGKNILNFTLTQSELDIAINNNFKYFMVRVFIDSDKKEKTYSTKNVMLLEGDYTNKPIPQYFEGMKSVGEKEDGNHKISISSIGKNIILDSEFKNQNGEWERFMGEVTQGYSNNVGYTIKYSGTGIYYDVLSQKLYDCNTNQNNILPNTWYTLSFYAKGNIMRTYIYPSLIDTSVKGFVNGIETTLFGDGCYAHNLTNEWTKFTYTFKTKSQIPYRDFGHSLLFRAMPNSDCVISCLMLEQGKVATEYKPQQVDKKEISLNEPLRGLPNGVKDTIEKINGEWKIVRRCGEVVLNGSEPWALLSDTDKEKTIGFSILNFLPLSRYGDKYKMVVCDRFPSYKHNLWKKDYEGITTENNINDIINDTQLQIIISKSELSTKNIAGFKQWLSQNPTKVIYQLDTPIIEDISPITLQCWKNGTISIDEAIPVETTHTVALNKSAQIQKNIEELTILRNRVKALEEQYDKTALNQAYEVELLRLDMQLDNII